MIGRGIDGMKKGRGILILFIGWLLWGGMHCAGQEKEGNDDYQYALIEAVKQKNLGNFSEAVKLYGLVIGDKPDCAVAYYELGTIYLMSQQPDLARENLEKAYSLDPANQWYTLAYANALGAVEDYETLAGILKEKHKSDPDEVEWEYQLATVYFAQGKVGKSIRLLEGIEKERGFSEKITLLKASIYESEENYDLARQEIEKVMNLFPETIQFRIAAAELSMKSGMEEDAAEYYLEILEIDSTNIFALTNLTDYYRKKEDYRSSFRYLASSFRSDQIDLKRKMAIMSYYLSDEKFLQNYPDELENLVQVFLEVYPGESDGRLMATEFYIAVRRYKEAYFELKTYLESNRGSYPIYMQAILLANAASLNEELILISGQALGYYPDSVDIRFFRGIGYYDKGDYELLIENFKGISFKGFSAIEYASQARMLYAEAFYRLEDFARSDSLFEALIADEPDNFTVLNNYSYYLAERGAKLERAREWSKRAITNNPGNATFLDTYAWVLFKLKKFDEAEQYILDALQKGGENDPEVNEHAGDIQMALESYKIAEAYYRKAILLGGDQDNLEEKIERIKSTGDE